MHSKAKMYAYKLYFICIHFVVDYQRDNKFVAFNSFS